MENELKIHDLIQHEILREEVCVITINGPVSSISEINLTEALCELLSELYEGPVKLVIFQGDQKNSSEKDNTATSYPTENSFVAQTKAEMLQDIISRAPYFSLSKMTGSIQDLCADIAIACDWRLASMKSEFCFAAHRNIDEMKTGPRLTELIGSFRAFDFVLRRRVVSAEEAIEIGLAMPKNQGENVATALEKHALAVKKESIAIMRRAVREPLPNDMSIERIVSSVSQAG